MYIAGILHIFEGYADNLSMTLIVTSFSNNTQYDKILKGDKMFTERLNIAIGLIGATNAELAETYGCDRSNISRIRSGNRVPSRTSGVAHKLVAALVEQAYKSGTSAAIFDKIGISPASSQEEAEKALLRWLYSGENVGEKHFSPAPFRNFGEKLGTSMAVAGISNIRLARALNVDPSHISRFRNGQRTPKSNPKLVIAICDVILERCANEGKLSELSKLTGIAESELSREEFQAWLCDFNVYNYGDAIDVLINSVSGMASAVVPNPEEIEELDDDRSVYYGITGLREAIIRLITEAIKNGSEELLFFNDQHAYWFADEPTFYSKWSSFMLAAVNRGIKVSTIHSLNRESHEIVETLRSWLPLYVSGNINAYYTKKQQDMQFSHCIFAAPGIAAISATCVTGREKLGAFYYHTDPDEMRVLLDDYISIQKSASPLVAIGKGALSGKPRERVVNDIKLSVYDDGVEVKRLREPETSFVILHPALIDGFEHLFDE